MKNLKSLDIYKRQLKTRILNKDSHNDSFSF